MQEIIQYITQYGYLIIFFGVLGEQLGVPLPAMLLLIVGGALSGLGELNLALVFFITVVAALIGDTVWFNIGRRRGFQVLGFLCRISLEPDSCVSGAKGIFLRNGARSLLIAKFVPGFSTFAPPLAGATGMPLARFLIFDALGSLIWVGTFAGLGYVFSERLEQLVNYATNFGWWFGAVVVGGLVAYIAWKFIARQKLLRGLRVARIAPEELKELLDAGDEVLIVDLRDALDFDSHPHLILNAVRIPPDELEARHEELPRDRDLILYCTCPNEITSARTALRLHRRGLTRVRPLHGGLEGWRRLKFPLHSGEREKIEIAEITV